MDAGARGRSASHRRSGWSAAVLALAVLAAGAGCDPNSPDHAAEPARSAAAAPTTPVAAGPSTARKPKVRRMSMSWVKDYTDRDNVASDLDHIYVATVTDVRTVHNLYDDGTDTPATVYRVEVAEQLKGEVDRSLSVVQFGGRMKDSDELLLVDGDFLLRPGRRYLVASGYDQRKQTETMLNTYGHTDLTALSDTDAQREIELMERAIEKDAQR